MKTKRLCRRIFRKSTYSPNTLRTSKCVGVSISQKDVLITHMGKEGPILCFNREEWKAFIQGVKDGEFDLT